MKPVLWLRLVILKRRLARLLGDMSVYMVDGAWVTYLFVCGFFGAVLTDFLMHPERLTPDQMGFTRWTAAILLIAVPVVLFIVELGKGLELSPLLLTPGESRFLLISPVPSLVVLGERLATLHLSRAAIGLAMGVAAWPFLRFLWSGVNLAASIGIALLIALLSGTGANLALVVAIGPQSLKRWLKRLRTWAGLLVVSGAVAVQVWGPRVGLSEMTHGSTVQGETISLVRLLTAWQMKAWLPGLVFWAGSTLLAWLFLRRVDLSALASHSMTWLKLRALLRAGRKAEAHRLIRQTESRGSIPHKRKPVSLYGPGVRAVLFKQLTILQRIGPQAWISDWLVPGLLLAALVLTNSAGVLRSVPALVGGAVLLMTAGRWLRSGSRQDLSSLYVIRLLPIKSDQLLIGQIILPSIGLLPLSLLVAGRVWVLLGGGWWRCMLLLFSGAAAAVFVSVVMMMEDWLGVQTPHSRERIFMSGIVIVLPVSVSVQLGPLIGPLVFPAAVCAIGWLLISWLRLELGKAVLDIA